MNPDHDDDPLPPLEVKKISLVENVSIQSLATTVGFFCFLGIGIWLTLHEAYSNDDDLWTTAGEILVDNGFSCFLVAIWQLTNSQELAYRKYKWWGLFASVALFFSGLFVLFFVSAEPPSATEILAGLALGQSIGPMITTVLLLEPKEKETLAMPYVNNFVQYVAQACEEKGKPFTIIVPMDEFPGLCSELNARMKAYKTNGRLIEHQLSVSTGYRKFGTNAREFKEHQYFFDVPGMLDQATPRKLALFNETLEEYLKEKQEEGKLLNVRVRHVANLTLKDIDNALLRDDEEKEVAKRCWCC